MLGETCLVLLFLYFIIKRKRVSFRHIGVQFEKKFRTWIGPIILGVILGAIVNVVQYQYAMVKVTTIAIDQSHWPFTFGAGLIIIGLLIPFTEEIVFRGILFQSLRNHLSVVPAIAIDALIFTAWHDSFNSWVHFVGVLLSGCITCVIFLRTCSLTNAYVFHSSTNITGVTLSYIFYVWT